MNTQIKVLNLVKKVLIQPSNARPFIFDSLKLKKPTRFNSVHLEAAIQWLCASQDNSGCNGSSGGYALHEGWWPAYPETTGYIIPTFLAYASLTGNSCFFNRAKYMADWELSIQLDNGAVRGGGVGVNSQPVVFNTGQVVLGLVSIYRVTKDSKYLNALIRACDWLVSIQDDDGKWSQFVHNKVPHTYHSRVAWPLLEAYKITGKEIYKTAAVKFINWLFSNIEPNGWIRYMEFSKGELPFTHTIAYTLRGLLECSAHLSDMESLKKNIIVLVGKASEKILFTFELSKKHAHGEPDFLPGVLDEKWEKAADYSCLTGSCQMAIVWFKLSQIIKDYRYLNAGLKLIDHVKSTQDLGSSNPGIYGAIAGSYPIWGKYSTLSYPNWATKFFADALILQEVTIEKLEGDLL